MTRRLTRVTLLLHRSNVSNDLFSDVMQLTGARSVLAGGFRGGGNWAIRFAAPHEVKFAVVIQGACWIRLDGQKKALRMEQGDAGLLRGREGYLFGSDLTAPAQDAEGVFARKKGLFAKVGTGSGFLALAGAVSLNPSSAALLTEALPPLIHISGASHRASSLRWIIEQIIEEQGSTLPGRNLAAVQLAQLLFVQMLRTHLATSPPVSQPPGWLRSLRDPRIHPALTLIHGEPGRLWRLSELAQACAMSRTSFAVRFKSVAGVAPLEYLAAWRMRLAQKSLREEDGASVAGIAASLGYASESAFSHAFKRETGLRPSEYRASERSRHSSEPLRIPA